MEKYYSLVYHILNFSYSQAFFIISISYSKEALLLHIPYSTSVSLVNYLIVTLSAVNSLFWYCFLVTDWNCLLQILALKYSMVSPSAVNPLKVPFPTTNPFNSFHQVLFIFINSSDFIYKTWYRYFYIIKYTLCIKMTYNN